MERFDHSKHNGMDRDQSSDGEVKEMIIDVGNDQFAWMVEFSESWEVPPCYYFVVSSTMLDRPTGFPTCDTGRSSRACALGHQYRSKVKIGG